MAASNNGRFMPDDKLWDAANLALGRYLSAWNGVESVVARLFRDLAVPDALTASIVLAHMSTRSQIETVCALLKATPERLERSALLKVMEGLAAASKRRNAIIHAHWSVMTPPPRLFRVAQSATDDEQMVIAAGIVGRKEGQSLRSRKAPSVADLGRRAAELETLRTQALQAREYFLRAS